MPFCPNPECPFRKRRGESAEYNEGTSACFDCNTPLVADDLPGPAAGPKRSFRIRDLYKRLLWTAALLGLWRVLSKLPLPGIDQDFLHSIGDSFRFRVSLFALGLMPYITASVIVEIAALLIQPLKRWRSRDGAEGRARIARTARFLTIVIGILHGRELIWQMDGMADGRLLVDNGLAFKSLLVLTLLAAVFLLLWIADQMSARGCVHGVSLLVLTGAAGSIPRDFADALKLYGGALMSPPFVMPLLAVAGAVALIVFMERSVRHVPVRFADGTETAFPVKLTTAGTQPVIWAHALLALSFLFVPWNQALDRTGRPVAAWIVENLSPGTSVYMAASAVLIAVLYFLFTALFFNPGAMAGYLRERNATMGPGGAEGKRNLYLSLEVMAVFGGLYLVFLPLSLRGVWRFFDTDLAMVDGISLIVTICIALDLLGELAFRWRQGKLVNIAEFHEPWKAGLFRALLEKEQVPALIRGYYHRSLLYLFGPYIEMAVYVPADRVDAAREVERKYLTPGTEAGQAENATDARSIS